MRASTDTGRSMERGQRPARGRLLPESPSRSVSGGLLSVRLEVTPLARSRSGCAVTVHVFLSRSGRAESFSFLPVRDYLRSIVRRLFPATSCRRPYATTSRRHPFGVRQSDVCAASSCGHSLAGLTARTRARRCRICHPRKRLQRQLDVRRAHRNSSALAIPLCQRLLGHGSRRPTPERVRAESKAA